MSTAEVCYLGATDRSVRHAADVELKRRGDVCENHRDEILAVHKKELEAAEARRVQGQGAGPITSSPGPTFVSPGVMR